MVCSRDLLNPTSCEDTALWPGEHPLCFSRTTDFRVTPNISFKRTHYVAFPKTWRHRQTLIHRELCWSHFDNLSFSSSSSYLFINLGAQHLSNVQLCTAILQIYHLARNRANRRFKWPGMQFVVDSFPNVSVCLCLPARNTDHYKEVKQACLLLQLSKPFSRSQFFGGSYFFRTVKFWSN